MLKSLAEDFNQREGKDVVEVIIDSIRHGTNTWIVVLKEKGAERYLPICVGEDEARAIARELIGPTKSTIPDLFLANIDASDAEIQSVIISRLEKGVFYSKMLLSRKDSSEVSFPTAMAIALAARANTPIFVEDRVLEEAGLTAHRDWPWGISDAVLRMARIA